CRSEEVIRDSRNSSLYGDATAANICMGHDATGNVEPPFAVAVGNIDDDTTGMDLVTGNDRQPGRFYLWQVLHDGNGQPVAGYITGTDIGIDPELVNSTTVEDPMPFSTSVAVAVVSGGTAEVTWGAGVTILASHDVTLSAHAEAKVDITTLTSGFGFTFGQAAPDATVALANGASITAANDFHMNASTNTDLKV